MQLDLTAPPGTAPRARQLWQILALAAVYYGSGQLSLSLAESHSVVSMVVFAAEGFALAATIRLGPGLWPGVFLGQFLLAVGNALPWPLAAALGAGNSVEAVLGSLLFKRWKLRYELDRVRDLVGLLGLIGLVLQPLSATLGILTLAVGGIVQPAELVPSWVSWWANGSLGQLLVVPFLLSNSLRRDRPSGRALVPFALLLVPGAWLAMHGPRAGGASIAFALTLPVLAWLAAQRGVRWASLAVAALALLALYAARLGRGPFVLQGEVQLVDLNLYLLCSSLTALYVAALFAERMRTVAQLRLSQQDLRAILEATPECVKVVSPGGELLEMNAAGLAMLEADSLQQVRSRELFSYLDPEDRAGFRRLHQQVLQGEAGSLSYHVTGHRGTRRWLRTRATPMRDATGQVVRVLGITQDVSEQEAAEQQRVRLEEQLRQSEATYRTLVSDLPVGVLIQSPTSAVLLSNTKALELLGLTEAQLLGRSSFDPLWNVIHEDGSVFAADTLPVPVAIATGRPVREVIMGVNRPGRGDRVWLLVDAFPVFEPADRLSHVVCTFADITQVRQAMLARDDMEQQLRESQKMEAIGTLAGGIAHDLNNALAIILGNVELAGRELPGTSQPQLQLTLLEIQSAGERARDMVRQILAFSRRQPTERAVLDLAAVVQDSARLLRATVPASIALDVRCAPGLPSVLANATQIQQVVINLVTNAMQSLAGQRGRIDVQLEALEFDAALAARHPKLRELCARSPGHGVQLTVGDSGAGMEAAVLARIFEPFYTTKSVGEGTGLGLSVVHGIVQSHDGAITVESAPGCGSVFSIYLPADVSGDGATATAPAAPWEPAVAGHTTGRHVLYVDDEEALVSLVKRLLEREGYRVSTYQDPEAALSALRQDPAGVDLLLTDYNMPGLSGLDVAREAQAIRADLPVAIISGFVDETLRERALAVGVRHLVHKADTIQAIAAAVRDLLQHH